jgi:hypothetical protein
MPPKPIAPAGSILCRAVLLATLGGALLAAPAEAQLFGDSPPRPPADVPGGAFPPQPPPVHYPGPAPLPAPSPAPPSTIQAVPLPPPPGATMAPAAAVPNQGAPPQALTPAQRARLAPAPMAPPPGAPLPPGAPPQPANPPPPQPADTSPQPDDTIVTEMPTQKIENARAVFSGLDKITGRTIAFDAGIGETVQFGALRVTPRVCYTRPPTEATNTDAFVQVDEVTLQGEVKRIFSGWMFAASPGLNAVEHPIYDVWLTDCASPTKVAEPAVQPAAAPAAPIAPANPRPAAQQRPRQAPPGRPPAPPAAPPAPVQAN